MYFHLLILGFIHAENNFNHIKEGFLGLLLYNRYVQLLYLLVLVFKIGKRQ